MAASPGAPSSRARLYALLAALAGYAAVGWCVLAIVMAVVGDPLTNLLPTHNNAMLAVSSVRHAVRPHNPRVHHDVPPVPPSSPLAPHCYRR
jgi:hypothetical protein